MLRAASYFVVLLQSDGVVGMTTKTIARFGRWWWSLSTRPHRQQNRCGRLGRRTCIQTHLHHPRPAGAQHRPGTQMRRPRLRPQRYRSPGCRGGPADCLHDLTETAADISKEEDKG